MNRSFFCGDPKARLFSVLGGRPQAVADITGSGDYPELAGRMRLYQTNEGVVVFTEVRGLPRGELPCQGQVFGFHIHEGTCCCGGVEDPFSEAMAHYNPDGCEHPGHAGDLPPLFGNNGFALSLFLTDRFSVGEVIGRAVIIHRRPDDFTTQPSGNSGAKIACGIIRRSTPCR